MSIGVAVAVVFVSLLSAPAKIPSSESAQSLEPNSQRLDVIKQDDSGQHNDRNVTKLNDEEPQLLKQSIYAIAHGVNTLKALEYAVGTGINAVEMDLGYLGRAEEGKKLVLHHGVPCDCNFKPNLPLCQSDDPSDKMVLCKAWTDAEEMFTIIATQHADKLAMVYLDTKTDRMNQDKFNPQHFDMREFGRAAAELTINHLFEKGFRGSVTVSAPNLATGKDYHYWFAAYMRENGKYLDRCVYAIDQENDVNMFNTVMDHLISTSPYRGFGAGISAMAPGRDEYKQLMRLAANNFHHGSMSVPPIIWTLDSADSMRRYLTKGARGIMSNDPKVAVEVILQSGLILTPVGELPPKTVRNERYSYPGNYCDCNFKFGRGCRINPDITPPRFYSCDCTNVNGFQCEGEVVECMFPEHERCIWPDSSKTTCEMAGPASNCGGY